MLSTGQTAQRDAEDGVCEGWGKKVTISSLQSKRNEKKHNAGCVLNELRVGTLLQVKWKVSFLDQPALCFKLFNVKLFPIQRKINSTAREQMQNVHVKKHELPF